MANAPISLRNVKVKEGFWKDRMELVRKEVIPYQWDALNDRIPEAAKSYCMRNYRVAGKLTKAKALAKANNETYNPKIYPLDTFETLPEDPENLEDRFYGFLFQDSDFSKWVEAVAYSLTQHPDAELEGIADDAIDVICAAQQENGYLDTYYIINDISKVFTNLRDNHELYCFGHLTEGAVAYYQATGKDKLLKCAARYADYIYSRFGYGEGQIKGYPGHEIAEMALVRLYEATGDKKYLELCNFFLDERGVRPYYFDSEMDRKIPKGKENEERYEYNQAHKPVREQDEAVGHAVRAVYLYSGMADAARINGDAKMLEALDKIWKNITEKKMYITGGIGATHHGEAFSFNYDLPNDTAYSETCAAIGLVFFARRMLQIRPDSKYADVAERALYNGVLSGIALDGKSFFYVNPLSVDPEACKKDPGKFHVKPVRQKWFGCACCPPNIARLLSSIAAYAFTEDENTLYVHQYISADITKKVSGGEYQFSIDSKLPDYGKVKVSARKISGDKPVTLAVRIPGWCDNYSLNGKKYKRDCAPSMVDGCSVSNIYLKDGYLYITGRFEEDEVLEFDFDMPVKIMVSNQKVTENEGRVAVTRGPLVYCLEQADNGEGLNSIYLDPLASYTVQDFDICGLKTKCISTNGIKKVVSVSDTDLYSVYTPVQTLDTKVVLIPYFSWANRGEGQMQVWCRYYEK